MHVGTRLQSNSYHLNISPIMTCIFLCSSFFTSSLSICCLICIWCHYMCYFNSTRALMPSTECLTSLFLLWTSFWCVVVIVVRPYAFWCFVVEWIAFFGQKKRTIRHFNGLFPLTSIASVQIENKYFEFLVDWKYAMTMSKLLLYGLAKRDLHEHATLVKWHCHFMEFFSCQIFIDNHKLSII